MDKFSKEEVFKKALNWFISNNSSLKNAALELFSEDELRASADEYKIKQKENREKERKEQLQKMFERCKKLFPIGTPIWSDEGSDKCLNIIISEPYIGKHDYHYPMFIDYNYTDRYTTILVKTIRIEYFGNDVIDDSRFSNSIVCLENCLYYMDKKDSDRFKKNHIINLKEYIKNKEKEKSEKIKKLEKDIKEKEESLEKTKQELKEIQLYEPAGLTKEKIEEIVKRYTSQ